MHKRFVLNMARGRIYEVDGVRKVERIEPGKEDPGAELYPILGTTFSDLGDFGLGIALYFRTLATISVCLFVCFLINLPVYLYYKENYHQGNFCDKVESNGETCPESIFPRTLVGSAWCPYASSPSSLSKLLHDDDIDDFKKLVCIPSLLL